MRKLVKESLNENYNDVPIPGGSRDPRVSYTPGKAHMDVPGHYIAGLDKSEEMYDAAIKAKNMLDEIPLDPTNMDEKLYEMFMTVNTSLEDLLSYMDEKIR